MRPISVLNVEGRIFLSVLHKRLASFLINNRYIPVLTQKGFIEEKAGCIEHGLMIEEALKYGRHHNKALCISWLDLANAFGSVHHNLVQFCLKWYHVPHGIATIISTYYNSIFAFVETSKWCSK